MSCKKKHHRKFKKNSVICGRGYAIKTLCETTAPLSSQSEQTCHFSTNQAQYPNQSGRGLHALSRAFNVMVSSSDSLVNLFVFVMIDNCLADETYFSLSSEATSGRRFKNESYQGTKNQICGIEF